MIFCVLIFQNSLVKTTIIWYNFNVFERAMPENYLIVGGMYNGWNRFSQNGKSRRI